MTTLLAKMNACGDATRGRDEVPRTFDNVPPSSQSSDDSVPSAESSEASAPSSPAAGGSPPSEAPAQPTTSTEGTPAPIAVVPPVDGTNAEPETPPADDAPSSDVPVAPAEEATGPEPDAATRARCTGTNPIECHFGGAPGNYEVSVELGGAAVASTKVLAEMRRTLLDTISTAAGETRRFTFGVNVRQPEAEPIQAVPAGTPGLDLYFVGAGGALPAVRSIGFRPASDPLVIYVAGDSTVADQTGVDYGGWGQQLPQHFSSPVVVANYADSGESSGSFLGAAPLFGAIESRLAAKDWVLIQFGHNDKQVAAADFRANITQLVTRVKAKGASPVLITPVARAQFNGNEVSTQHVNGVGANLPQIIREVANQQGVPLLDLTARTTEWLREVGPNGWQQFHALGTDVTHTNDAGALVEAGFVRELIVQAGIEPLVRELR